MGVYVVGVCADVSIHLCTSLFGQYAWYGNVYVERCELRYVEIIQPLHPQHPLCVSWGMGTAFDSGPAYHKIDTEFDKKFGW